MGYITEKMERQPNQLPCTLDAAAILDSVAEKMIQVEPDTDEDRLAYWATLVAGVMGCCSASIGFQAAGVIGQQAVDAMRESEGRNGK